MKENHGNWRIRLSISKLPNTFLLGLFIVMGSISFAQAPGARMTLNNEVVVRTGLNPSYEIYIGHFKFATKQEAEAYFQPLNVPYINFVVLDKAKVQMNFDLTNPAVANWTLSDWQQALSARASNSTPRPLPNF